LLVAITLSMAFLMFNPQAARAATTWNVTSNADANVSCSTFDNTLRQAICHLVDGDTIDISSGLTITLAANLPNIFNFPSGITIEGHGAVIDGANSYLIFNVANTALTVNNLTLQHGSSSQGSAFNFGSGTLTINDSTLDSNSSSVGGAIYAAGTVNINRSTLSSNQAPGAGHFGGAIYIQGGTVNITNSTLTGNSAAYDGAIYLRSGSLTITSSTVTGNFAADGLAGAIGMDGGTFTLQNSIVALNHYVGPYNSDIQGTVTSLGYNFIGEGGSQTGLTNGVNNDTVGPAGPYGTPNDPLLGALGDNGGPTRTMKPTDGSPVLDKIPSANCAVETDQTGTDRPQGTLCDIGAYEVEVEPPPDDGGSSRHNGDDHDSSAPSAYPEVCPLLGHPDNPAIRGYIPDGLMNGSTPVTLCYGILTDPAQYGVTDRPVTMAVEVMAFTPSSTSVAALNQPVKICLQGSGLLLYRDATGMPRTISLLTSTSEDGFTCAVIPNAGTVILTP
jgi:hypothetical protein